MIISHFSKFLLSFLSISFMLPGLFAQNRKEIAIQSPLFNDTTILEMTLEMDIKEVTSDVKVREDHDGVLSYINPAGEEIKIEIKLKTRGKTRANPELCSFPPLELNFKKKGNYDNLFKGQDKLKLVAHCQNSKVFDQYVLQEYITYKHYNLLSENSFKVRLLKVNYVDAMGKKDSFSRFAFLIEEDEVLAYRRDKVVAGVAKNQDYCERESLDLMTVFQYMIGNTDWDIPSKHNIKLIAKDTLGKQPIAIPYDFDYSGAIKTHYAVPDEVLQIANVRTRLFRGYCRQPGQYEKIFSIFNEKKSEIYNLYENFALLEDRSKQQILKYFDDFYETTNNPKKADKEIIRACEVSHKHIY